MTKEVVEAVETDTELRSLIEKHLKINVNIHKERLQKEFDEGGELVGVNGIRRRLGAIDLEFYGKAYYPHYFARDTPVFHKELDEMWCNNILKNIAPISEKQIEDLLRQNGKKIAECAPRGHAKSTKLTFQDTTHAVLYGYKKYPIIISDSSEQANSFLENIKAEFEENERILEDFGNLKGEVWRGNVILLSNGCKIEAIGSGKKIRGRKHRSRRPDLIILDDVENDENVRTKEQRTKLLNWFTKAVSKAGDTYTDIVFIGTLLHYDSLLANVMKNPSYSSKKYKAVISWATNTELWDEWEKLYTDLDDDKRELNADSFFIANKKAMLEGTKVLWKEKNSYYDLMKTRVSDGESSFNSELQNEPINPDDCLFNEEWIDFYNEAEIDFKNSNFSFFGFVDPSLGKSKNSDYSAIIIIAKDKTTGYMYVLDADIERRHPDKIITDVLEKEVWLRKTYNRGYKSFGAESNQFQWFLKEELKKASSRAGLYLPIKEVYQTSNKEMRISTMQPDVKNKYIKFNKRHKKLLEQLYQFPMGAHDDGIDALEGCRTIAKNTAKFTIMNKGYLGF